MMGGAGGGVVKGRGGIGRIVNPLIINYGKDAAVKSVLLLCDKIHIFKD